MTDEPRRPRKPRPEPSDRLQKRVIRKPDGRYLILYERREPSDGKR